MAPFRRMKRNCSPLIRRDFYALGAKPFFRSDLENEFGRRNDAAI
jgi:hypothetical protein